MVRVYKNKSFNIYSNLNGGFIIHNTKKEFSRGHTHINNFKTAKYLINLAIHKSIPKQRLSNYLYDSLIRISDNKSYINTIKEIKNSKHK